MAAGERPLRDTGYVQIKAVVAVVVAAIPILAIYLLGLLTDAEGSTSAWLLSAVIVLAGAVVFALYGLVFGLAFRSEAAVGAASGSLVILAFMGNIFFPLSGTLLTLAKFTPLYGYVALARYPLTEGYVVSTDGGTVTQEPLWVPLLNVSVWALIFAVLSVWLVRRGRARQ